MEFAVGKCTIRTPTGKKVEDANCVAGKATRIPKPVLTFSDVRADKATQDYGEFLKGEGRAVFMNAVNAIRAQILADEAKQAPDREWMTSVWIDVDGSDPHFPRPEGFGPHRLLVSAWLENANPHEWNVTISFRAFRTAQGRQEPVGYYVDAPFNQPKLRRRSLQLGGVSPNSPAASLSTFGNLSYSLASRQEWLK